VEAASAPAAAGGGDCWSPGSCWPVSRYWPAALAVPVWRCRVAKSHCGITAP